MPIEMVTWEDRNELGEHGDGETQRAWLRQG